MSEPSRVPDLVASLAAEMAPAALTAVAARLSAFEKLDGEAEIAAMGSAPGAGIRSRLAALFARARYEGMRPETLALSLAAAAGTAERLRATSRVDLVLSGPGVREVAPRRIDEALYQLIKESQRELLIVSYAAYKVDRLRDEIRAAMGRGVDVTFVLEDGKTDKVRFDALAAFGRDLANHLRVLRWPLEHRERGPNGKTGSLHAKLAVADRSVLLVSSANLTEFAFTINLEAGVLVRGGPLPRDLAQYFTELERTGVFVEDGGSG